MSKAIASILRSAQGLIDTSEKWTKGVSARDGFGLGVGTRDPRAVCRCSLGAISAITEDFEEKYMAHAALRRVVGESIAEFNDASAHREVMVAFAKAIEAEEAAQ